MAFEYKPGFSHIKRVQMRVYWASKEINAYKVTIYPGLLHVIRGILIIHLTQEAERRRQMMNP